MGCLDVDGSGNVYWNIFRAAVDCIMVSFIILGNAFIIFAVVRHRSRNPGSYASQPSTLLVINLSSADVLVGIFRIFYFLPWYYCSLGDQLGHDMVLCILRFSLLIMAHTWSGYTLIAIALDRYLAVTRAVRYTEIVTPRRTMLAIAVIWLLGVVQSSILFAWNQWENGTCDEEVVPVGYTLTMGLMAQLLVLGVAATVYWRIHCEALRIRRVSRQMSISQRMNTRSARAMIVILGVYFICWAPIMVLVILKESGIYIEKLALQLASSFLNINYLVNPFIYAYNNHTVRKSITSALRICRLKGRTQSYTSHSISASRI